MKIKVKKQKLWLGLLISLLILVLAIIIALLYPYDNVKTKSTETITTEENYVIEDISLENKTVNDIQYQILNIDYYDDNNNLVNKQILVDFEKQSCLWNSDVEISSINYNEVFYTVYENGIEILHGEDNAMLITKRFYRNDFELESLSVKITLTKENYEKIFP